jgi:hypothetical protein
MTNKKIILPEGSEDEEKDGQEDKSTKPSASESQENEKPKTDLGKADVDKADSSPVPNRTHAGGNATTIILLVILLIIASLTLYFVWHNSQQDTETSATTATTTKPTATETTKNDADTAAATSVTATSGTAATKKSSSFETALNAKDYNAMKPLLADPINFVLDASECCGDVTADKAIAQLKSRIEDASIDTYDFSPSQQIIQNMKVNQPQAFGKWNNIGISKGKDFLAYNLNANGKVSEIIMGFTDSYDLD